MRSVVLRGIPVRFRTPLTWSIQGLHHPTGSVGDLHDVLGDLHICHVVVAEPADFLHDVVDGQLDHSDDHPVWSDDDLTHASVEVDQVTGQGLQ